MKTFSFLGSVAVASALSACGLAINNPDVPPITEDAGGDTSITPGGSDAGADTTFTADSGLDAASNGGGDAHVDATIADAAGDAPSIDGGADGGHDATLQDAAVDSGPDAIADAAGDVGDAVVCPSVCTSGQSVCGDGGVLTCEVPDGGSCRTWVETTTCGVHQTCGNPADGGAATCSCIATACAGNGTACQPGAGNVLLTCTTDVNGCAFVADAGACSTSGYVCSGSAPNAACSATCTSTCALGQQECVGSDIAVCGDAGNGCLAYGFPGACSDSYMSCTGSVGTANCTCNADPFCSSSASSCYQNGIITCHQDTSGCWYHSTSACGAQVCYVDAGTVGCCTTVGCTPGAQTCDGSGVLQTCVEMNGCTSWVPATPGCASNQKCTPGSVSGTASCLTGCLIGGSYEAPDASEGATGTPACQMCNPSVDGGAWIARQNGTSCGANEVCSSGACVGCVADAGCTPTTALCDLGTTSCTTGASTCVDLGPKIVSGTTCDPNTGLFWQTPWSWTKYNQADAKTYCTGLGMTLPTAGQYGAIYGTPIAAGMYDAGIFWTSTGSEAASFYSGNYDVSGPVTAPYLARCVE